MAVNRWVAAGLLVPLLLAGGCRHKERDVGERVDPDELYYVPSIIASARRLVDDVQQNRARCSAGMRTPRRTAA